jgi:hypothetical protein
MEVQWLRGFVPQFQFRALRPPLGARILVPSLLNSIGTQILRDGIPTPIHGTVHFDYSDENVHPKTIIEKRVRLGLNLGRLNGEECRWKAPKRRVREGVDLFGPNRTVFYMA